MLRSLVGSEMCIRDSTTHIHVLEKDSLEDYATLGASILRSQTRQGVSGIRGNRSTQRTILGRDIINAQFASAAGDPFQSTPDDDLTLYSSEANPRRIFSMFDNVRKEEVPTAIVLEYRDTTNPNRVTNVNILSDRDLGILRYYLYVLRPVFRYRLHLFSS